MRWVWAGLIAAGAVVAVAAASAPAAQAPSFAEQQQRLSEAKTQSRAAAARADQLQRAAAAEQDEATKARVQEAAVAAGVQPAEADIAAAQARIAIVNKLLGAEQARLAAQQTPIVRLMAALQSMARRPALIALVQPGSVDDMVHVRAVLADTLPVIRRQTAGVRADLDRARQLKTDAQLAAQSLADSRQRLEQRRLDLARLEAEHRLKSRALGRDALVESDRAIAMGEQARDIVDLMNRIGNDADTRQELASLPGPLPRPPRPGEAGNPVDTVPWTPSTAPYRLPVAGKLVTGFGELSDAGVRSRGLTFTVARGAEVVAPSGGHIAYAGPFRDYGQIVIIDHGQGWTTLLSGLGTLDVRTGETIGQGAPVGKAPDTQVPQVTIELRRKGRPVDMLPLTG